MRGGAGWEGRREGRFCSRMMGVVQDRAQTGTLHRGLVLFRMGLVECAQSGAGPC